MKNYSGQQWVEPGMTECGHRSFKIAQSRAEPPDHQPWIESPQPRNRQLRLHAALASDQLMPLVDDDVLDPANSSLAFSRESIRLSDSGVVTSTVGKRRS
jgi:hypothetical protein